MNHELRRGRGPWPVANREATVHAWLCSRMAEVEEGERVAMARWMLDHASSRTKGQRLVDAYLWNESQLDRLAVWAERVSGGEPLQHVLGVAHFDGLTLEVNPHVLIPRPETEELVAAVAERVSGVGAAQVLVDWCTGSGCMALALKRRRPNAVVVGLDVSREALEVARRNAAHACLNVEFQWNDLRDPAPTLLGSGRALGAADVVVANPPYIPASEASRMASRVTRHEPHLALFVPDDDPLCFVHALWTWCEAGGVKDNGWVGVECHTEWATSVAAEWRTRQGWVDVQVLRDLQGLERHVLARRKLP